MLRCSNRTWLNIVERSSYTIMHRLRFALLTITHNAQYKDTSLSTKRRQLKLNILDGKHYVKGSEAKVGWTMSVFSIPSSHPHVIPPQTELVFTVWSFPLRTILARSRKRVPKQCTAWLLLQPGPSNCLGTVWYQALRGPLLHGKVVFGNLENPWWTNGCFFDISKRGMAVVSSHSTPYVKPFIEASVAR